ncbi:hypothetical protein [Miltoncostaea oceani]|uniref:hypothetical protein n=1 Tax=Miltoncostaea oceani TaxID=2843216 RepID=UPI001C3D5EC6|nr:hypothetical protein [Miltoncostaea oceani]
MGRGSSGRDSFGLRNRRRTLAAPSERTFPENYDPAAAAREALESYASPYEGREATTGRISGGDAGAAIRRAQAFANSAEERVGIGIRLALINDDISRALELRRSLRPTAEDPQPMTLSAARRLAIFEGFLGKGSLPSQTWLDLDAGLIADTVFDYETRRLCGDRAEALFGLRKPRTVETPATSREQIIQRLHAVLRHPDSWRTDAELVGDSPRIIGLRARKDALADFIATDLAGVSAVVETSLKLQVSLRVSSGTGKPHLVRLSEVGRGRNAPIQHLWASDRTALMSNIKTPSGSDALKLPSAGCDHRGATWELDRLGTLDPDQMRLACPDCLRERVAIAPLHRVQGVDLTGREDEYLRIRAAMAFLEGDARPITSLDALRIRDGQIALDPRAHAHRPAVPAGGSPRSVAGLMRRGRGI